ncbi:MAG: membrane protein insertase YidC [Thioalkalivibrionaceae bacterium]
MDSLRPILWLSLLFVLFLLWQAWNREQIPQPVAQQDSAALEESASFADVPDAAVGDVLREPAIRSETPVDIASDRRTVRVVTDTLELEIDTRGGTVLRADLMQYPVSLASEAPPVRVLDERRRGYVAQSGLLHIPTDDGSHANRAPNHHAVYTTARDRYDLGDADELRVPLVWRSDDGIEVEKTYVFKRGSHLVELEHVVRNASETPWLGRQYRQLRHGTTPDRESWFLYTFTGLAYFDGSYQRERFESFRDSPIEKRFEGGWASIIEHYFLSAWIPNADELSVFQAQAVEGGLTADFVIRLVGADPLRIEPGAEDRFTTRLWIGPKLQNELSEIAKGLELTVDYGIFTFLAKPLFWLLGWIHAVIGNWGWSIVVLTIAIKLAFFHLSAASYRSMARMRAAAPKLQALKERYGDDRERMGKEMMALYKKEKINPLGGCLPILVQIPVFIALYWVLLESVELRQAPWMLWIQDLSVRDPFFILPILMGVTMFVQFKLNPPPMDPMQAKIFAALPFVFTVFFAFFPAGLVLYWFTNNLFSIAQQWFITRRIEKGRDPEKKTDKI